MAARTPRQYDDRDDGGWPLPPNFPWKWVLGAVGLAVLWLITTSIFGMFGYIWYDVNDRSIGVKFSANNPYAIVGSGKHTNVGLFESMKTVTVSGLPFSVIDEEVLTKDKQRLGIVVSGTVHRPGLAKTNVLLQYWSTYANFYLQDDLLVGAEKKVTIEKKVKDAQGREQVQKEEKVQQVGGLMQDLGKQAAKVCLGGMLFDDAVIGAGRDKLRDCINEELDKLSEGYKLEVHNIVVPNFVLNAEVQEKLDQITSARLSTDLAKQREQQVTAEANQRVAQEQGQIRVDHGKVQEKAKQDAITADLERKAKEAQNAVIEADKKNVLLAAEKDLGIAKVNLEVAQQNAKAQLAPELVKVQIYEGAPSYLRYLITQALAQAYKNTDKFVVIPDNVNPMMFMGNVPGLAIPAPTPIPTGR